jgi:uncharacterized protein (DUF58 family)
MSSNANAFRLAFFTALIYFSALTIGLPLLYYLSYVLFGVLVAAFLWSQLNKRGLQVRRQVKPPQAQVGQHIVETIELRNLSWLRKLWLEVRDRSTLPGHRVGAVVTLPGRASKRWQVRTRCVRRGLYRLGPTVIHTGDPFGLFQSSRVFESTSELLVYPPTVPLESFGLPPTDLPGGTSTQRRAFQSTPNAAGIRDYLPGDPMNKIHWPVSARMQKLMVKEFEIDPTADIWLVLDLDRSVHVALSSSEARDGRPAAPDGRSRTTGGAMLRSGLSGSWVVERKAEDSASTRLTIEPSTEEYGVVATASLAAHFIEQGRSVGLIAWGQHKVTLPADRGGRQLVKILRALAVLRAGGTTSLAEVLTAESRLFARQDTIVVVTPSVDELWVRALQTQTYKGVAAVAVLIEPATFGGVGNSLMVVSALSAFEVPTYLIKRDDSIDLSLSRQYSGTAALKTMR